MKKFLALLLSLMMVLSLAACGGSDDTSDDTADPAPTEDTTPDDTADTETPEDTGEKFNLMTDITRIDPPELEGTTWNFAGGYLDGEEMDDDDATQTLSLYGGTLQFVLARMAQCRSCRAAAALTVFTSCCRTMMVLSASASPWTTTARAFLISASSAIWARP